MTFDSTKPVQTKDERKATIIHTLKNGDLVVIVEASDGDEDVETYGVNGIFDSRRPGSGWDLVNIPEKRWAILFEDFTWCQSHEDPGTDIIKTDAPDIKCIACLEFTEGQGL